MAVCMKGGETMDKNKFATEEAVDNDQELTGVDESLNEVEDPEADEPELERVSESEDADEFGRT